MIVKSSAYPMFEEYSIPELAELTGYSTGHLLNVKRRNVVPSLKFRAVCAMKLERPASELFGDDND